MVEVRMAADRYTRIVLTLIAAELLWLGLARTAPPVAAQAAPTPVVITGIDVNPAGAFLPVGIVGSYRGVPPSAGRTLGPLSMSVSGSVLVETIRPIKVESDRPLKVESVDYTPRARPGE
jgi:hypothetical protein